MEPAPETSSEISAGTVTEATVDTVHELTPAQLCAARGDQLTIPLSTVTERSDIFFMVSLSLSITAAFVRNASGSPRPRAHRSFRR
jgi:hypothetical protein